MITPQEERRLRLRRTAGYYAAFLCVGLASASLGPTLPALAGRVSASLAEISFLFMARSLGYLVGSFLSGRLYDRLKGHPVMAAALLIMGLTMWSVPGMNTLGSLMAVIFVIGTVEGSVDVGGNAQLMWTWGRDVGPYMNGLHLFYGVGAFLAPIVVARLLEADGGLMLTYRALALTVLPVAGYLLWAPAPASSAERNAKRPLESLNLRILVPAAVFLFLYVGAEVGYGGWIYTYALATGIESTASSAYLTSAFWGFFTLGRLLAVPAASRFPPRRILAVDLAGCVLCLLAVVALPQSRAALWGGTIGLGLCMASIFPTALCFAGRRMKITGRVTSWFLVGSSTGAMFLPWLMGQVFAEVGPRAALATALADLLLASALLAALALLRPRAPRRLTVG